MMCTRDSGIGYRWRVICTLNGGIWVQVMVGVCVYVLSDAHVSRAWRQFQFCFAKNGFSPFSFVVVFIIFYKYGIWAFLGCQACFMCSGGVLY